MATLVVRHPDGSEHEHPLSGELSVGRADGNDLVLSEGGVSRKHARFFTEGGQVLVEDAGSANGTFVDGERIEGPTPISGRAQVVIGDYEISIRAGAAPKKSAPKGPSAPKPGGDPRLATGPLAAGKPPRATKVVPIVRGEAPKRPRPSSSARGASGPQLKGLSGAVLDQVFPLSGVMTVGRVPGVDLQLEDDSVSRRHAELEVRGGEVLLRDLGSANGTTVNGAPLTDEATLQPGDIVQFGVVELAFESGGPSALARRPGGSSRPVPRRGASPERSSIVEPSQSTETMPPGRKKLFILGGVVVGLLFVLALVQVFTPPPPIPNPQGPIRPNNQPVVDASLEDYLSLCRQHASTELGEPNWDKAEAACRKVLDLEPIHDEASELLRKIKVERGCEEAFTKGKRSLNRTGGEEDALASFERITRDCSYYLKALPLVKEGLEKVKKSAGEDCRSYANNGKWEQAMSRCDRYMTIACQGMQADDLQPPPTMRLSLNGPVRKGEWRPKDQMYLNLLRARDKVDPKAGPWACKPIEILRPTAAQAKPTETAKGKFAARYKEQELVTALTYYFDGKSREAIVVLQRTKERIEKSSIHSLADSIRKDMADVDSLFKDGQDQLRESKPDRAAEPFREALAIDERLMLGDPSKLSPEDRRRELEKLTSYFRRNIQQDMASQSYQRGKDLADRQDFKQACKVWKLGFTFWKGNADLLRAITNVCTRKANELMLQAGSCDALDQVLEFAVPGDGVSPGDGFTEQAREKKTELGCP